VTDFRQPLSATNSDVHMLHYGAHFSASFSKNSAGQKTWFGQSAVSIGDECGGGISLPATVGVGLREEWKIIGNSRNTEGIGKRHTRPIPPSYLYTHLNSPGLC